MESPSADQVAICESNTNGLTEYPFKLQCIYLSELEMFWNTETEERNCIFCPCSPFHTPTPPTISLLVSLSVTSFITVCFVIIFLYSKPHFVLVEIDGSDDTKQFIAPFIPCFLLIASPPSVPLCVSGWEWEEVVGRLIGYSANYPAFCGCPVMTGLTLGCREILLERIMQWHIRGTISPYPHQQAPQLWLMSQCHINELLLIY